ncbi:MAG: outer membrane lipoprotein-sorting protein [Fimbriimonadaceae bacterium]|nr:outer membrane lipoprotein-sorting protein [Fimbriimonadaceae bacterium]
MHRCELALALLLLTLPAGARSIRLDELTSRSRQTMTGVNDFTCRMTFTVRASDLRVPESRLKIYFKKPDKFKPEAIDGDFAVLPKTYNLAIGNILERMLKDHTARILREETVRDRLTWVLKLTPQEEDQVISYHLVYVDQEQYTVSRLVSYPRQEKPATMNLTYLRQGQAWLPQTAAIDAVQKRKAKDGAVSETPVAVRLRFDQYKVNVGLSDSIFKD